MGEPRLLLQTTGVGFSDDVIHLGTFHASADELSALEDGEVTVDITT